MIDLHMHSLLSDGVLIPTELIRRLENLNYAAAAITDHSDFSTLDFVVPRIIKAADDLNNSQSVTVIPGVELTHIPPVRIGPLVKKARELGAKLVVVHGETIVEPVPPGTNRAGLEAGVDILAHPGLITLEDAKLAAEKGILLEISARAGHSLSNGHVARMAEKSGAKLVLNSDAHSPKDLMSREFAQMVLQGAGFPSGSLSTLLSNARLLLKNKGYDL